MNIGIIVQARYQSTRLPGKVLLDFYEGKTILEILIDNLANNLDIPIVVATSVEPADDQIVNLCERKGYKYFRGSENDVLSRFIGAAKEYNFTHIVRVCSDNPFMLPEGIQQLIDAAKNNPDKDYISFKVNDSPSILTHFGLWAELAKLSALEIAAKQNNKLYFEHVTNYFYKHSSEFDICWLKSTYEIAKFPEFRLTVDTQEDFDNAKFLYERMGDRISIDFIIKTIINHPNILDNMIKQIEFNSKKSFNN